VKRRRWPEKMSLNILQHKSWHVWTQKNIERVKKDQEENRKQEDRKRKRELDIVRFAFSASFLFIFQLKLLLFNCCAGARAAV
jgi:hypothetical protein